MRLPNLPVLLIQRLGFQHNASSHLSLGHYGSDIQYLLGYSLALCLHYGREEVHRRTKKTLFDREGGMIRGNDETRCQNGIKEY